MSVLNDLDYLIKHPSFVGMVNRGCANPFRPVVELCKGLDWSTPTRKTDTHRRCSHLWMSGDDLVGAVQAAAEHLRVQDALLSQPPKESYNAKEEDRGNEPEHPGEPAAVDGADHPPGAPEPARRDGG